MNSEVVAHTFVEVNGETGIKIDSGEFSGVIVTLSNVYIQEADDTADAAVLSFTYDVVWGNDVLPELLETVEFKDTIGNIIIDSLTEKLKNESKQIDIEESSL